MTETTTAAIRVGDEYAAQLAEFSDEWGEIHRQQAVLDARKARLLARSAAYADAFADVTVPAIFPPAERQALSRRSTCAALAMATRTPERTIQRATNDAERLVNDAPAVLASLEAGRISARHAQVITDQLCDVPAAGRAVFLEQVLPVAESATVSYLRQRARVLRERLHPESITARAARSEADRRVEFEPAADGMAWVHLFTTAPIAQGIIERVETAAAESRNAGDNRTCAQLQADALAALALTGVTPDDVMSSPVLPHPIEVQEHITPTVQITVPALSMAGVSDAPATLDGYGPIDPETAARIAANCTQLHADPCPAGNGIRAVGWAESVPGSGRPATGSAPAGRHLSGTGLRQTRPSLRPRSFGRVGRRRDDRCREPRLPVSTSPPDEAPPRMEPRPPAGWGPRVDDTRWETPSDGTGSRTVLTSAGP
jgi:hypothetical protein